MSPTNPSTQQETPAYTGSSMSVAGKPICSGEECIGRKETQKDADKRAHAESDQPAETAGSKSSVAVAGKEQCSNGACIGLTDGAK